MAVGHRWLVIGGLILFWFLALASLVEDSPTMDEQNHLTRGLTFLATGDARFSLEHPPLINVLSALPVYGLLKINFPFDHPSWEQRLGWYEFAEQLVWVANRDVARMMFLGRLPVVWLTMGLGLVGFCFAKGLRGSRNAGTLALFLILFDPNILAHGRYITTDLGGTLFVFLATYWLWRWWHKGNTVSGFLWATVGLGLAFGSKLSALTFIPIWMLLAVLPLPTEQWNWKRAGTRLFNLGLAGVGSLFIVWIIFGGEWRALRFDSSWLSGFNQWSAPMPTFWAGIEQILALSDGGRPGFLLGEFSAQGFPLYFPIALAVKTPLPTLILLFWAVFRYPKLALWAGMPALIYFLVATQSSLNIGYRHLLPILPFFYLIISQLILTIQPPPRFHRHPPIFAFYTLLLLFFLNTLQIHPHYLSYFNTISGGPLNGGNILIDSNIDWGQDLIRLHQWMQENNETHLNLSWFGIADPNYYNIAYTPLPGFPHHLELWWNVPFDRQNPQPGLYAISVSNLGELPLRTEEKTVFAWFRTHPPDARIGYSIYIYDLR